jgi:protoporphyrinogen oxidase
VSRFSWDESARTVLRLMEEAVERGRRPMAAAEAIEATGPAAEATPLPITPALASPDGSATAAPRAVRQLIIGAGPTGLAAAYYLGEGGNTDTMLVEREDRVGGWCRSVQEAGYTWDYAGHIMFSNDQEVLKLYDKLLGDNLHWQNREAWIYSKNVYTRYPFQGSLYGLPPEVLKECITGAIEARFGSLKANFNAVSRAPEPEPANFEEFIYRVWGKGIAKHFAVPYNQKLWAVPLNEMETSWLGGRVPLPDLEQMIEGALKPTPAPMGPNARFGYPLRGGFQALMNGFLPHLKCEMALNTRVVKVSPANRTVLLDDGRTIQYETLISTMPLPALVQACGEEAPAEVQEAARGLRHVSVRCVNLGVKRENITDKHWIYYPEDSVFHRIFVQGNASPHCNAPGGFALTAEITYSPSKPLPCDGQALIDRVIADCRRVGLINEDDEVEVANQVDMPCAYVVYDHARAANVNRIREWMGQFGIVLAGRYSEWEYYNSDHAFVAGRKAAEQALEAQRLLREAVARRVNEPSANEEPPKVAAAGGGADEPAPVLKAAAAVRAAEIARLARATQVAR